MKRWFIGLGALVLVGSAPFIGTPVFAQIQKITESIVETIRRPEVKLTLTAEKQIVEVNTAGEQATTWEALAGQAQVFPGDVLRYTIDGANSGDVEAENLVISQAIPAEMTYVLASATPVEGAELVYSIDGGETFVAEPMVEVTLPDGTVELQPAPAEAYTHVRWSFGESLASASSLKVAYDVQVK
ncbi:MAG: hypothetical protein AAF215_16525 [Cyanobacteria bacterium P01_A01_bin.123]